MKNATSGFMVSKNICVFKNIRLTDTLSITATVARGKSYDEKSESTTETDISTSGDWAQDESLVALLAQNPYFNDDTVRGHPYIEKHSYLNGSLLR